MRIQTVTVTDNSLDSLGTFIESVTIYSIGEGPSCDIMGYIAIKITLVYIYIYTCVCVYK